MGLQARDWFDDGSVFVVDVALACCALETQAAAQGRPMAEVPEGAKVVATLSGTLTTAMAPAVRHTLEQLPANTAIVAFGACACVGGPYWDSYAVTPGAEALGVRVDHFIAGCPPPPEAIHDYLEAVRRG